MRSSSSPSWAAAKLFTLLFAAWAFVLSNGVSARSTRPPPVKRVHQPAGSSINILPRTVYNGHSIRWGIAPRSNTLRHDDTLMLTLAVPSLFQRNVSLILRPNLEMFHPDAKFTVQGEDDTALRAEDWRLYHGDVIRPSYAQRAWAEVNAGMEPNPRMIVGDTAVMIHEYDEHNVQWEGSFKFYGRTYHVLTRQNYLLAKHDMDADLDPVDFGNGMVIWTDNDIDGDWMNEDLMEPTYEELVRRGDMGGAGSNENYAQYIGSTKGCPETQNLVYAGVALHSSYIQQSNGTNAAKSKVLNDFNQISALFKKNFKISIGLTEMYNAGSETSGWQSECSDKVLLEDRLSQFSQWMGENRADDPTGFWHMMSNCRTGSSSEIGVAWVGTLGRAASVNPTKPGQWNSAASTSTIIPNEWTVAAHEIGHVFGAIHDCTDSSCGSAASSIKGCCPYSTSDCSANGRFIMNPESNGTQTEFSKCTVGNVCHWIETNVTTTADKFQDNIWGGLFVEPPGPQKIISEKSCGNGIVEDGEQCDPGLGNSACCTPECKYATGAVCDPNSDECCQDNCQYKAAGTVCRKALSAECDTEEKCTGNNGKCPKDERQPDGEKCGDGLTCASGRCTSLDLQCQQNMNITEACGQRNDESCKVWCKSGPNQCNGGTTPLLDGSPCGYGGKCYGGDCKKGSWQTQLSAMYTQNLQYAVPITVVVGLVILAILWSLLRCMFRCCGGGNRQSKRKPYETRGPAPPLVIASNNDLSGPEYSAGNPLLAAPVNGHHNRNISGATDQNVPMQELNSYNRGYDSYGPGGYSDPYQHEPNLFYQGPPGTQASDPYAKGPVENRYQDGDWIDQRPSARKNDF